MDPETRFIGIATVLGLCVLIETLTLTYVQRCGATFYYSSSILYFLSGLAICFLPLLVDNSNKPIKVGKSRGQLVRLIYLLFFLFLIAYHIRILIPFYHDQPVNKYWADMLPSIQLACQHFLHGQTVYSPAPEIRLGALIPYLPMMWIPFLPAEIFGFDYRWVTLTCQVIGLFIIMVPMLKRNNDILIIPAVISGIALFFLSNYFLVQRVDYWILTQEGVVAGFYLLLCVALLRQNVWLIGLAMMACTLSRYSLLFWVPVYFLYSFFTLDRSGFWKLLSVYTISILIIFVLPFFIKDPMYFINIPAQYMVGQQRFWNWNGLDEHQYFNVGFYKFFDIMHIPTMLVVQVITSFLAPILLILSAHWAQKRYAINTRYLGFASLKISLMCFYGFISMPYLYIFLPPTIISYVVLFDFISQRSNRHESSL